VGRTGAILNMQSNEQNRAWGVKGMSGLPCALIAGGAIIRIIPEEPELP